MTVVPRQVTFAICVPAARPRASAALLRARGAIKRPPTPSLLAVLPPLALDLAFEGAGADDVARLAERALVGGELMRRDVDSDAGFALPAVWALIYSGLLGAARQVCEDAIAYARDRGSRYAVARISAPARWCPGAWATCPQRLLNSRAANPSVDCAVASVASTPARAR